MAPNPPVPQFTPADLTAIDQALGTGATEVRFQDRTVRYRSTQDLLLARTAIYNTLYPYGMPGQPGGNHRQIRMYTSKGL